MKIARVEPISVAYQEPNDNHGTRYLTLCRIETTDGVVGWGEAVTMWPEASRATEAVIHGLAPLIHHKDPVDNELLWEQMRDHAWWYGHNGGLAAFAISAIDMALWDLKGKLLSQPLINLLGGARRKKLPVIASSLAFHSFDDEILRQADYVERGYQGVKVGIGKPGPTRLGEEVERDIHFVQRLREACGDNAELVIDRSYATRWDMGTAMRRIEGFTPFRLRWMEEPLEPQEVDGLRRLRDRGSIMIGTGEREWDPYSFAQIIRSGAVDVVGCDPARACGITGARRVIHEVESAQVWFNAHAWSSAIGTAASLALALSTNRSLVFELKPLENPMQHELIDSPLVHHGGEIYAPNTPGLGIAVRQAVVQRYRF